MTLGELIDEVNDRLSLEGAKRPASVNSVIRALNQTKDWVVDIWERRDQQRFMRRVTRSVAAGDASVGLPDGSVGGEWPWKRLVSVVRVEGDVEHPVKVNDPRIQELDRPGVMEMELEGDKLYFGPKGAPESMTLRIRYSGSVPDLANSDKGSSYEIIPARHSDVLVLGAVDRLLPSDHRGHEHYRRLLSGRLDALLGESTGRAGPLRISRVE